MTKTGDIGFTINSIATAEAKPSNITLTLQEEGEYNALMKYVRGRQMKIIQVYKEPHNRGEPRPCIGISGSCLDKAGFSVGDMLAASYEQGIINIQKLDF